MERGGLAVHARGSCGWGGFSGTKLSRVGPGRKPPRRMPPQAFRDLRFIADVPPTEADDIGLIARRDGVLDRARPVSLPDFLRAARIASRVPHLRDTRPHLGGLLDFGSGG